MAQSVTSRQFTGHPRQSGERGGNTGERTGPRRAQQTLAMLRQKQLQMEFKLEGTPYSPVNNIGTGAYGVVCSALHTPTERKVAIKKIPKAFGALTLIKRTLREVQILRHFRHENIVAVLDMFQADGTYGNDVYMVMDLMETDLHQIIHSRQSLSEQHLQYFMYQILRGLKYIHSAGVIHRDLKPSNLLVNADCLLKIGDFGMARSLGQLAEKSGPMTQYVATRWYRAPELVFSMLDYTTQVDLWSVGCIFAELIMRRQLFPGKDHVSQLKLIVSFLGTPAEDIMDRISSDIVKTLITSMGHCDPLPWASILPKASAHALDLIDRMMQIAPWQRISSEDALQHAYLEPYHDPEQEPVCSKHVVIQTDNIESLEPEELKAALELSVTHFDHLHRQPDGEGQKAETSSAKDDKDATSSNVDEKKSVPDKEPKKSQPRVLAEVSEETAPSSEKDIHMLSAKMSAHLLQDDGESHDGETETTPAPATDSGLNSMSEPEPSHTPEPPRPLPPSHPADNAQTANTAEMELASEINEDILGSPSTSNASVMPTHFPRPRRVIQHTDSLLRRREAAAAAEEGAPPPVPAPARPLRKRPNSLNEEQADLVRRIFSNALLQSRVPGNRAEVSTEPPPALAVFAASPKPSQPPPPGESKKQEQLKPVQKVIHKAEPKKDTDQPIGIQFYQPTLERSGSKDEKRGSSGPEAQSPMETTTPSSSQKSTPASSARPLYAIKAVSADGKQQIFQPTVVEVNLALEDKRARQAAAEASVVASAARPPPHPAPVRLTTYRTINAFAPAEKAPPTRPRFGPFASTNRSRGPLAGVRVLGPAKAAASLTLREPTKQPPPPPAPAPVDPKALLRSKIVAKGVMKAAPSESGGPVTAHERRLEREEKKKRRESSKRSPVRGGASGAGGAVETEHDRALAERWARMQRQCEANAIQGEIGDLISESVTNGRGAEGLDSSNLMSTWVEASQLDPEVLQDLEKEIQIN